MLRDQGLHRHQVVAEPPAAQEAQLMVANVLGDNRWPVSTSSNQSTWVQRMKFRSQPH
jgi:hypothetical protein